MKKILLLLLVAVTVLVTCGRDADDDPKPTPKPTTPVALKEIKISEATVGLKIGDTHQYKVTYAPAEAKEPTYVWESSDTEIATISSTGLLTGVKNGETTIKVSTSDSKFSSTSKVTVSAIEAESINFDNKEVELMIDESHQLTYKINPENTTDKKVSFSSSDSKVVSVDSTGLLKALTLGEAKITIKTSNNLSDEAVVKVLPIPSSEVRVDHASVSLFLGESFQVKATVLPETATDKKIIWTSANESIATVSSNGNIKGIGIGSTQIYARTASGTQATVQVVVKAIEVTAINLDKTSVSIFIGDKFQVNGKVVPDNATNKNIIWTSANESIATVSSKGLITGHKAGSTKIYARSESGVQSTVDVTVKEIEASKIALSATSLTLTQGSVYDLAVTFTPSNTTNKDVVWSSSDNNVATVVNGQIKAVSDGNAVITASTANGRLTATCAVKVVIKGIEMATQRIRIAETEIAENSVLKMGSGSPYYNATWTSENPSIAIVAMNPGSNSAKITGVSPGSTTITVTSEEGHSTDFIVTVDSVTDIVEFFLRPVDGSVSIGVGYVSYQPALKIQNNLKGTIYVHDFIVVDDKGNVKAQHNWNGMSLDSNWWLRFPFQHDIIYGSYQNFQSTFRNYIGFVRFYYNGKEFSIAMRGNPNSTIDFSSKHQKTGRVLTR